MLAHHELPPDVPLLFFANKMDRPQACTAVECVQTLELDRITDLRRRLLIGLGLGAAVLGIALTPPAILSAVDAERAYFVHMISDATPWQLLGGAGVSFGLAVVLLTIARRDARRLATQG